MGNSKVLEDMIDQHLLDLHTAFVGKVISTNGATATVQPMYKIKQYGEAAQDQAILSNIPIANSARHKIKRETITYVYSVSGHVGHTRSKDLAVLTPLAAGDLVLCVCCERNISEAIRGKNVVPPIGHHTLSDSIIVAIL